MRDAAGWNLNNAGYFIPFHCCLLYTGGGYILSLFVMIFAAIGCHAL
ncbi:MAG: hypothetical protein SCH71_04880 [Desulfobulbaceae bacterium]|nr:hypothetical protein [Desulfobulbaceae bacterium]